MKFGMTTLNQKMETEQNCYTDTGSFVIHIITEDFYKDIDVERRFDKSNYDENNKRPL